jgi:glycosyltransferase involved in cell wall biosynthesis
MAAHEPSAQSKIGDVASAAGLRRVHLLAWRDLEDVEAGGSEVHADEIATRWAAAGLDVLMRTSRAHGRPTEDHRHGYRVIRRGGRHSVFLDATVQELLHHGGPRDGLLEVWNGLPFFSPVWARGPRATFIHHVHADMWHQVMTPGLARLGQLLELRVAPPLYRRTEVLTPSESSREEIIRRLGFAPERVAAIPNGVDERFQPGGARSPRPRIVSVGRLVAHKHVDRLIDAAALARDEIPELELVIAGDGYARHDLERHIRERDAESWVHLLGRIDDDELLELYRSAWVVASASSDEGWGMTITEAAACGTPAVVTRIVGHTDCIDDGVSGLLAGSTEELGQALARVLGDTGLRERLAGGALARVQGLTWDHTALQIMQALAETARR